MKQLQRLNKYQNYFDENEFGLALNSVEKFFWNDFCDNYLELIKDQLFNPDQLYRSKLLQLVGLCTPVGLRILQMYAPYLPHLTENIYAGIFKEKEGTASIHQTRFTDVQHPLCFSIAATATMEQVNTLIGAIRKLKTEKQLSLKTSLETLTIFVDSMML